MSIHEVKHAEDRPNHIPDSLSFDGKTQDEILKALKKMIEEKKYLFFIQKIHPELE